MSDTNKNYAWGGVAPLSVTQPHKQAISSEQATPNPAQLNLQFVISLYDSGASTEQALLHTTLSTISSVVNAINHSDTTACHVSMTICASKAQQYVVTALQQAIKGPISFSVAPKAVANLNQVLQQSTADYICVCRAGDSYPQDFVATVCSSVHALPQDAAQSASAAAESPYPYDILVATAVDTKDRELSPWRDSNVATQRFALLSGLSSCILRGAYLREHQLALPEHDNALYSLFLLRLAQDPAIKIKPLPQARVVINEQAISAAGSNHASDVLPSLQQLNKALKAIPVTTLSPAVRVSLLAALFNDLHRSAMRTPAIKPRLTYCETLLKAYDKLHQQLSTEAITFSMGNIVLHNSAELFDNRIQGNKSLLKALQHHSVDELFAATAQVEHDLQQDVLNSKTYKADAYYRFAHKLAAYTLRLQRQEIKPQQTFYLISAFNEVPVYQGMFARYFQQNPFYCGRDNIKLVPVDLDAQRNAAGNISLAVAYNNFLDFFDLSADAWLIFIHPDFEVWDDLEQVYASLDRNCIYGPCGAIKARDEHNKPAFRFMSFNDTLSRDKDFMTTGRIVLNYAQPHYAVDSLDSCYLSVHTSLLRRCPLRFDPQLSTHLVAEDFNVLAKVKYGIETRLVELEGVHHSSADASKLPTDFMQYQEYLASKYPDQCFAGTCCFVGGRNPDEVC